MLRAYAEIRVQRLPMQARTTIGLGEPDGYPRLIENRRMRKTDLARALKAVFVHRSALLRKWSEFHE